MIESEVKLLCDSLEGELVETHISWVILTEKKAFKIKKPVTFSFLDFSDLQQRKHMCEEELRLNRRLTKIYKSVQSINSLGNDFSIGNAEGDIIDYAVVMDRMPEQDRMDLKLASQNISQNEIEELAHTLANFHKKSDVIQELDDMAFVEKRFKDVLVVSDWLTEVFGNRSLGILEQSMIHHDRFIKNNRDLLDERVKNGFKRDVHGDLHVQNIFMTNEPVIFDCIEFDKRYRQIDVLSEMAFLNMDIESSGRIDLADHLLNSYLESFKCINTSSDQKLFDYYKMYRANVKIKVLGLKAMNDQKSSKDAVLIDTVSSYLRSLEKYVLYF